jgi:hypothetical protein
MGDASSEFVSGGLTYSTTSAIANTDDDVLYQSERYGDFTYSIPLPSDEYNVVLKYAEIYQDNRGARIFDVNIEGHEVIHNFDILVRSSKNTAYDVVVPVALQDGILNIAFATVADNAKLSALEVRRRAGASAGVKNELPKYYSLGQNYPNPFNPTTTLQFSLPIRSDVRLVLYNPLGQIMKEVARGSYETGYHTVTLNASQLASGVYFYRIEAGSFIDVKKLIVLK